MSCDEIDFANHSGIGQLGLFCSRKRFRFLRCAVLLHAWRYGIHTFERPFDLSFSSFTLLSLTHNCPSVRRPFNHLRTDYPLPTTKSRMKSPRGRDELDSLFKEAEDTS